MSLDGIVTRNLKYEIENKIVGGRVSKIYQPEKDEIVLNIYNKSNNQKLLLSANSSHPRIHFTKVSKANPQEPPLFCMVLRKHLAGAQILSVGQYQMDRIIYIDCSSLDELGLASEKRLIIEIMGRHSNIILIDKKTNKIIDSVYKVSYDMSRVRQILPGLDYCLPPEQDKSNPLSLDLADFKAKLKDESPALATFKFFYQNYQGLSPLISREICFRSNIEAKRPISSLDDQEVERLFLNFKKLMELVETNNYSPRIIEKETGGYQAFYSLDLEQYNSLKSIEINSISEVLDTYFRENAELDRIKQKSHNMKKTIETKLDRSKNKYGKQLDELEDAKNRDKYKVYADLISANFHNIKEKGLKQIRLPNFYSENMEEILIPLDSRYDAYRNAQNYYKKYSRLKNAEKLLTSNIIDTKNEILYLENTLNSIENSLDLENLEDIRDELIKEGYIKARKKKRKVNSSSKPHHYISSEGHDIYVGKNNRQNDQLTMKFANKDDYWLHVQNMPGSHVIIRNSKAITNKVLEEAAMLAAYFSSAKMSQNVAVDYTFRKNVKKPNGAKPGLVIYEDFSTIFVTPKKDFVDQLKSK